MAAPGCVFLPSVTTVNETPRPEVIHWSEAHMSIVTIPLKPGPTGQLRCSYRVYWRDPAGRQHSKSFRDGGDAQAFDTKLALDRDRLRHGAGDAPTTFGAVAERWLAVKAATKRESTVVFYESTLRNHVLRAFAHVPVGAITRADVQDWINALSAKVWRPTRSGRSTAPCSRPSSPSLSTTN